MTTKKSPPKSRKPAAAPAPEPEGSDPMTPYPLRLPRSLVRRINAMAQRLAEDPELRIIARGRVTSGAVARLALSRGLDSLELEPPGMEAAACRETLRLPHIRKLLGEEEVARLERQIEAQQAGEQR